MLTGGMLDSHDGKPGAQFDRIGKNIRLDRYKPLVEVNQANKSLVVLDKDGSGAQTHSSTMRNISLPHIDYNNAP